MPLPNVLRKLASALSRVTTLETDLPGVRDLASNAKATADAKAPANHASPNETYGRATGGNYGHVKLSDATNSDNGVSDGFAATPKAVKAAIAAANSVSVSVSNCLLKTGGTMTGALKVPTAAAGLNDTTVATTAWVRREMLNIVYPVGSIYMSVNNVSPQTFLGGTWASLGGRFLFGADSSHAVNSTGGEAAHVITANELPKHVHTATIAGSGKHTHTRGTLRIQGSITSLDVQEPLTLADNFTATGALSISNKNESADATNARGYIKDSALGSGGHRNTILLDTNFHSADGWSGVTSEVANHAHTATIGNAGGSTAMSMMPPYLAVYMWKRTK